MSEMTRVDSHRVTRLSGPELVEFPAPAAPPVLVRADADNSVHSQPGQRFEHLFEARVDLLSQSDPDHLAIDSAEGKLTYGELDGRSNQLARHLKRLGFGSGDRLALLFDKSIFSYIATLAVLKIQAAYVPLDASFPADRIAFIAADAEVKAILSLSRYREDLAAAGVTVLHLDDADDAITAEAADRLSDEEKGPLVEDLAYIIYTSGSTGKPKGVPIDHPQIVNFVNVAAETYGILATDRMYQGLTIAFDFAVEEIWVPLAIGATLVPGPVGSTLVGSDLGDFLRTQKVSALCCVPTLLATLDASLPDLRYVMVSGEACPQDLVARWQRPGRRFLNAYGPTEATVTATLNEMVAGKPVTIGKPLPTYAIVILDPAEPAALAFGETGEIGIAGIGVARGYLNRDELTKKAFIPDFLGIENNISGRIYRTGDLGRINADGEVEYMGRIDTQVKIRGYRIELTEIESVLMQHPDIAQAVVNKYEPEPGSVELAAYFTRRPGVDSFDLDGLVEQLKLSVPRYMVPAYFTELEAIPLLPSHKADRKRLPKPTGARYTARRGGHVAPEPGLETDIASALCTVLSVSTVSAEDNFFDDLGGNSLLMARFSTKLRETMGGDVSMRDIYSHPSVRKLAAQLAAHAPSAIEVEALPEPHRAGVFAFALTGIAQAVAALVYLSALGTLTIVVVNWIVGAQGLLELYGRVVGGSVAAAAVLVLAPVALKWLLVGRWQAETFPIWGIKYFRFWLVKQLIRANPMRAFAGTPLYNIYLRLLGARIGRNVLILANAMPVATDLISIGDDTVISKDSFISGYRARAGRIETGAVTIGARAFVGEATVLTINTQMGDDTQLGNSSSLQPGQSVPAGKHYHGSPAIETTTNYCRVEPAEASLLRRFAYGLFQLIGLFGLLIPAPVVALVAIWPEALPLIGAETSSASPLPYSFGELALFTLGWSLAGYVAAIVAGLILVFAVPRLAYLLLKPGRTYRLYGFHYFLLRTVTTFSNAKSLNALFGDSSYITGFLQFVGWNLGKVVQMGSNFGSMQKHDVPFLSRIGTGTMVSDGLSMINAEMSATSFKLAETSIGANNFLGNMVFYPAGGRTGDNVLLATKVLIPLDGEIRENVGLLGSPSFEIPRTVKRDTAFDYLRTGAEFEERLRAKNRSNLVTALLFMLTRWLFVYLALGFLTLALAVDEFVPVGVGFALATLGTVFVGAVYFALIERLTLGFKKLEAKYVSIYDPYYWHHERHWKVADNAALMAVFNGTPFKALAWRAVGVKVGKRLFDDGCGMTERSLVELGDYVTLGEGSTLQSHTMEDATFKSDFIRIGNGATIGSNAYINYGVEMGENAVLASDSFLMKGTTISAGSIWGANPARQMSA